VAVHSTAAVAEGSILGKRKNAITGTLSHVHDVLTECILGNGSADAGQN
jgi:hypothetical protein